MFDGGIGFRNTGRLRGRSGEDNGGARPDAGGVGEEEGTQAEGAKAETPAAELPKVNVKIGYELNPGEPADLGANAVKTALESAGQPTGKVVLYPSSQLGNKSNLIDECLRGFRGHGGGRTVPQRFCAGFQHSVRTVLVRHMG